MANRKLPKLASRRAFLSKIDRRAGPTGCWPWTGPLNPGGYGTVNFQVNGLRVCLAHRMSYFLEKGALPPSDRDLRHSCDNRPCCNPAHLIPGTRLQNMGDMRQRGRSLKGRSGHAQPRGAASWAAKLTEDVAVGIRADRAAGALVKDIAAARGLSAGTISEIVNNKRWVT